MRNIIENPAVAVLVDRSAEDWRWLGWMMLHGRGEVLFAGSEHDQAQTLLRARYRQLENMQIAHHPVIAVRIARSSHWGNLSPRGIERPHAGDAWDDCFGVALPKQDQTSAQANAIVHHINMLARDCDATTREY